MLSVFGRPDEQIRDEITHQVLPGILATAPHRMGVTVRDGIVTLSGRVHGGPEGRNILEALRHVQGVVAVRDRLSYPADG